MPRMMLTTLALVFAFPLTASAHKIWLLPSNTVLSGDAPLVTVDAAVSNDLFYFNHHPVSLDNLVITAPDGSKVEPLNKASGRYRSVFDVPLSQKGTYKIGVPMIGLSASWEENGQRRRWRGKAEDFAANVPASAQNLQVFESVSRVETYVSNGAPSEQVFQTSGKGIELAPVTHPNDLYAGSKGVFRLLVDGKPAEGLKVEIIRGGTRYRDSQDEVILTTNAQGEFSLEFKEPGMYWLETTGSDKNVSVPQAKQRSLKYTATFEVLPQ